MSSTKELSIRRLGEVLNALERCFLAGDSPGVKLAAGLAVELLTGAGVGSRPVPAATRAQISFAVSVTILSPSMDQVLVSSSKRGAQLPRLSLDGVAGSVYGAAQELSRAASADPTAELALLGRPLSIELWDDDIHKITICLNYLAISRSVDATRSIEVKEWRYVDLQTLDLNSMDPRECLALSEMLTTMGFENPYDMTEHQKVPPGLNPAA